MLAETMSTWRVTADCFKPAQLPQERRGRRGSSDVSVERRVKTSRQTAVAVWMTCPPHDEDRLRGTVAPYRACTHARCWHPVIPIQFDSSDYKHSMCRGKSCRVGLQTSARCKQEWHLVILAHNVWKCMLRRQQATCACMRTCAHILLMSAREDFLPRVPSSLSRHLKDKKNKVLVLMKKTWEFQDYLLIIVINISRVNIKLNNCFILFICTSCSQ